MQKKISMYQTGKIIKIENLVRLIKSAKNAKIIKVEKLVWLIKSAKNAYCLDGN